MQQSILWIDDALDYLNPLIEVLLSMGYSVDAARTNLEALEYLNSRAPYDLVIQDMMRPAGILADDPTVELGRYSGLAFFERYLVKDPRHPPVLFFTMSVNDQRVRETLREIPRTRLLSKMGGVWEFVEVVQDILSENDDDLIYETPMIGAPIIIRADFQRINETLLRLLAKQPHDIHKLSARKFEELVARLLEDQGYEVELTPATRDGGVDILAIRRADLVENLYLVECKRYAEKNPVGIGYVQRLFGVKHAMGATAGVLVTSSYFSLPAKAFQSKHRYDISLKDYADLQDWLSAYS